MLEAIVFDGSKLSILDQLLLPQTAKYITISSVQEGWDAIKTMKVRGAPALSIVAALSLSVELLQMQFADKKSLHEHVVKQSQFLSTSRPTAVNLKQVLDLLTQSSSSLLENLEVTQEDMKKRIVAMTENMLKADIAINRKIGHHGASHIQEHCGQDNLVLLTHCNTGSLATAGYGTALGVIRMLQETNHLKHAYCTETRPYNQGARLTAYELTHDNIPATLICDSMVGALMKTREVSAVVVGADRVVANGDTANKIGTYQIAVCAKHHNVPFYVASPRSTIDFIKPDGGSIPIEERPPSEMTSIQGIRIAAKGIQCWNPAFDVTPAELITGGIITECGVFKPQDILQNRTLLSTCKLFD